MAPSVFGSNNIHKPIYGLFHTCFLDFAGLLRCTPNENRYSVVCAQHIYGLLISKGFKNWTCDVSFLFLHSHISSFLVSPKRIISYNLSEFSAQAFEQKLHSLGVLWKHVLSYSSASNERFATIIGTLKVALLKKKQEGQRERQREADLTFESAQRMGRASHKVLIGRFLSAHE